MVKRRSKRLILGIIAASVVAAGGALYYYADTLVERRLRPATIELLERRLDSHVELASLEVAFTPMLSIRGEGLTVRHRGRMDIPPLITMRSFTIAGGLLQLWNRRIDRVRIQGLEFVIPPRRGEDMPSFGDGSKDDGEEGGGNATPGSPDAGDDEPDVHIGELLAEETLLTIMSKRADKGPRVFQIRRLRFDDFQFSRAVPFEASLTNPTPHGEIETSGSFGPWAAAAPSLTPVQGTFVFDADLGTIKGIGGALHAEGNFSGPLEYIRTSGQTRTEGFHLSSGGARFPLLVDYDAIVDGTNGDTTLERVDAMLGESRIEAKGAIVKVEEPQRGRRITLDTSAHDGRIEDFVTLATRVTESPLTGVVNLKATLDIPPGEPEVIERMRLEGTFTLAKARFTSKAVQAKVDELSRRGQGKPTDASIDNVVSNMRGAFRLRDARLQLNGLRFAVQGANVQLGGSYDIAREVLDFKGELRLQARASQTQTGWKRTILRIFDPLLDAPDAGTVLPISVTGTKNDPKFSADIKKAIFK